MIGLVMLAAAGVAAAPAATERLQIRTGGPSASSAVGSESLGHDRKGRPTIPVRVNGQGPFPMVVDTAAQVSLVSAPLAAELKLPALDGSVTVSGATGGAASAFYGIDRLQSGLFDVSAVGLPALPESGVTDARGIVGMDMFVGRKLTFDTEGAHLDVSPSAAPSPGFVAVKGQADAGGLLTIPVIIDGRTVTALVDSGAQGTIATPALLDLLGWTPDDSRLKNYGTMRGAGGAVRPARAAAIETFMIGPVRLSNVPVVITGESGRGDDGEPIVILGSDLLNLLPAYAVDAMRGELQIRVPAASPVTAPAK